MPEQHDPDLEWQIGDIRIQRVLELELAIAYNEQTPFFPEATPEALKTIDWLVPDYVTPEGAIRLSFHSLLIDVGGMKMIVDTCVGNDRRRAFICDEPLQSNYLAKLNAAGFSPETVDIVMCTHMHVDHVGWNTQLQNGEWVPTFPNAKYVFAVSEFNHFMQDQSCLEGEFYEDSIKPIVDAGMVELVEPYHRFCSEISLFPTPGHSPGHVSIALESRGERAIITGDAIHHPCQFVHPDWQVPWDFDSARSRETRRNLINQLADDDVLVIGTHFAAPTAGHVISDRKAHRFKA